MVTAVISKVKRALTIFIAKCVFIFYSFSCHGIKNWMKEKILLNILGNLKLLVKIWYYLQDNDNKEDMTYLWVISHSFFSGQLIWVS